MVIWGQNKLIWLILKKIKFKIQTSKFIIQSTFIIHKNRKKISIQPILKSYSTSFMIYNFFSGMNIKIVNHVYFWGGEVVEFPVFTNIQSISTLVCLQLDYNGFLMCNYSIFYNTCWINHSPTNCRFQPLKSFHRSQFSKYRDPTMFIVKRKKVRIHTYLYTSIDWYLFSWNVFFKFQKNSKILLCILIEHKDTLGYLYSFSIKMENKIFNSFFTEIFVSKMFSKVSNKNFWEKRIKYIIFHQDGK